MVHDRLDVGQRQRVNRQQAAVLQPQGARSRTLLRQAAKTQKMTDDTDIPRTGAETEQEDRGP
jgi:hypothetical protein